MIAVEEDSVTVHLHGYNDIYDEEINPTIAVSKGNIKEIGFKTNAYGVGAMKKI